MPRTPAYVSGVVSLRGRIVPVLDLRVRLGLQVPEDTGKTCLVITSARPGSDNQTVGLIVDEVSDVVSIDSESIECVPELGSGRNNNAISGIGRVGTAVVILLNVESARADDVSDRIEPGIGGANRSPE